MLSDFLVDGAGRRLRIEVRSPLHAAAARLMASLGVEVTVVSAQELLRSRDCAKPGCVNEAIGGGEHCSTHREGAVQPVVVAAKAPAGFEALWCDVCKDESTANRSGECSWCGSPLLGVDAMKARLAQQASALSSAPRVEVAKPELTQEVKSMPAAGRTLWTKETIIAAIQRWAREHGGQPPSTSDWMNRGAYWPSFSSVAPKFGGWSNAIRAAGFQPRVQGGVRRSSVVEPKAGERGAVLSSPVPAAEPEPRPTSVAPAAVLVPSPSPERGDSEAGSPADDYSAWVRSQVDLDRLDQEYEQLVAEAAVLQRKADALRQIIAAVHRLADFEEAA